MTNGLEIILKVSERCNLNCSYCYYFNRGSRLYEKSAPVLSRSSRNDLVKFIQRSVNEEGVEEVQIDLHGGEPLLYGVRRTRELCEFITHELRDVVPVRYTVQTNGVLISEQWCDLFEEFDFGVGISLDGMKDRNDKFRVDLKGWGSYDRSIAGLKSVQQRSLNGNLNWPSVLCVMTEGMNGADTFDHLVNNLGCRNIDFLFPDLNHDDEANTDFVGEILTSVFKAWMKLDDSRVSVRVLRSIVSVLLGGQSFLVGFGAQDCHAVTVSTEGKLYADDTLRSCGDEFYEFNLNIAEHNPEAVFTHPSMIEMDTAAKCPPAICTGCPALSVCRGGRLINRWSKQDRFDRETVFCNSMKSIVNEVHSHLISLEAYDQNMSH